MSEFDNEHYFPDHGTGEIHVDSAENRFFVLRVQTRPFEDIFHYDAFLTESLIVMLLLRTCLKT